LTQMTTLSMALPTNMRNAMPARVRPASAAGLRVIGANQQPAKNKRPLRPSAQLQPPTTSHGERSLLTPRTWRPNGRT
jgi:hypothetical protein